MPRQPRIDRPDLLYHVIARGINRGNIFFTDQDREDFVKRLDLLLSETDTLCYAWALIPNHFHLLLIPQGIELSRLMRRLLTGYAVSFNHRHNRSGHVFQNRYKSIVCEEDTYLLELIRYIHLNPLRAGLVKDLAELDRYPWCGHGEIIAEESNPTMATDQILSLFSPTRESSLRLYQQFIADGIDQGEQPQLSGKTPHGRQTGQSETTGSDVRNAQVLGSDQFMGRLSARRLLHHSTGSRPSLLELQIAVVDKFSIPAQKFLQRSRADAVSAARIFFCYCAVRCFDYPVTVVARLLGIGPSSVSRAVKKGELMGQKDKSMIDWITNLKH